MMILNRRLQTQVEEHLADEQAGFRKDRGTVQHILVLRLLVEKARRKGRQGRKSNFFSGGVRSRDRVFIRGRDRPL